MGKWRRHSREFKQQVVEKMKTSDNVHEYGFGFSVGVIGGGLP